MVSRRRSSFCVLPCRGIPVSCCSNKSSHHVVSISSHSRYEPIDQAESKDNTCFRSNNNELAITYMKPIDQAESKENTCFRSNNNELAITYTELQCLLEYAFQCDDRKYLK